MAGQEPVCVITGGTAGVGLATAVRFGRAGYRVVTCGRDPQGLQQAKEQLGAAAPACVAVPLDLTAPDAPASLLRTAVDAFGRVDVLVNNAGAAPRSPLAGIAKNDFDSAMAVNVNAVFHATQSVWPVMQGQGGGVIVNISSMASLDPFPGFSVYGACKAWVNLFTKSVADEGRAVGIRVYSVALGAVETRMLRGLFPDFPAEQTLSPDDVAEFLLGLCGEPMKYATGQTIVLKK